MTGLQSRAKNPSVQMVSNEATDHQKDKSGASIHRTVDRNVHSSTYYNTFGEYIVGKQRNVIRIGFQNFNGLTGRENDPVDRSLRDWITDQEFDVFGVSEVNLYWPKVKKSLQFHERMRQWWAPGQTRALFAYNRTEKRLQRSIRQYGGTAQFCRGTALARECERGEDFRNLGRWVWQRFRGKNNKILRVITAYRPNPSAGPYTVYAQHRAFFNEIQKAKWEPRKQMLEDLKQEIKKWKNDKEQVILMMDCNEDVRGETMTHFLDETGMKEIILQRHGSKAPGTYIDGQAPIDGIFTSCSLEAVKAGYTSFLDGVQGQRTDHRCLWVDIDVVAVFGNKTPPLLKFTGRRVQSRNPNIVKTFNKKYKEFAIKHRLAQRIFQLEREVTFPISNEQIELAETIVQQRYEGI